MKARQEKEILIKNMICSRCIKVIRQDLEALGVKVVKLQLGKLKIQYSPDEISISQIEQVLIEDEFEFIKDKNEEISEAVKLALIEMVNNLPILREKKLSDYLTEKFHKDYWTMSKVFSKTEAFTIERYFILLRIEKAKELIEYDEMNFSEIAYELGFNNIYHLSGQFKQNTGMSMSEYKLLENKPRLPLDKIL